MPLPTDDNYFLTITKFGKIAIKKTGKVIENIVSALNEIPDPPKIELGNPLLDVLLTKSDDIIQGDYINIKDEYNFEGIKDAFDDERVPPQLEFFFSGENDNFLNACNFIGLNKDNNKFVSLLCSDMGQNILTNNSVLIQVESRNIFYNNFNTNENFYNCLLPQQDETKQFIPKCILYNHSFERYMKQFLT